MVDAGPRIDLTKPRYDQRTYWGRARHFFEVTDPRTILCSDAGTTARAGLWPRVPASKHARIVDAQ